MSKTFIDHPQLQDWIKYATNYMAAKTGSRELAQDASSDVLLKVLENGTEIEPGKSGRAYITTAVKNRVTDILRREGMMLRDYHLSEAYQALGGQESDQDLLMKLVNDDV